MTFSGVTQLEIPNLPILILGELADMSHDTKLPRCYIGL